MGTSTQEQQNQRILDYAMDNFSSQTHEYGREDMAGHRANRHGERVDGTRFNADKDGDGRKGVDCSSMVYYALQGAGFNLDRTAGQFTTATLFNGRATTSYAQEHFDILPAVSKTDGSLKIGDILMMKMPSGAQHVAIFKGYDEQGRIQFFGSQTSTGPATVTLTGNTYWDKQTIFYGALRPKEEFIKPEFRQSQEQIPIHPVTHNPFANPDNFGALETLNLSPIAQTIKQQCHSHVHGFCERNNQPWTEGMDNTYMALTVVAREAKMSGVDFLGVSRDNTIHIEQVDHKGIFREAQISAHEAANIPLAQSEQRLAIVDQQMLVQEQQQAIDNLAQTQHKAHSGPRMG